jgi:membrane-associated phospholipid phosphatase
LSTSIPTQEGLILEPDRRDAIATEEPQTYGPLIAIFVAIYFLIAASLYFIRGGNVISPDKWLIALFIGAVLLGKGVKFLRDWIPFLFLLFGYEFMRGIAGNVATSEGLTAESHGRVQIDWLIDWDRKLLWGHDASVWLQQKLYTPGQSHWYDAVAAIAYLLHFVYPLIFAFALWLRRRERFWEFSLALLVMSYSAFVFFLLLPTAPPWMAYDWGMLEGLQRPSREAFQTLLPGRYDNLDTFTLWTHHSPNPVAALPSLHAAFPWLVLLFAVRFFGRWGWFMLIYNAAVWFAVIYLGQHWVIDIIAGIIWATLSYLLIVRLWPKVERKMLARKAAPAPKLEPIQASPPAHPSPPTPLP